MPMDRSKKWKIKTEPDLLKPRLDALHDLSSEEIARAYQSIDEVYSRAKPILNKAGILATNRAAYRNYVQELWRICSTFTRETRRKEAVAMKVKYSKYGMDTVILNDLAKLFGLGVPIPTITRITLGKILADNFNDNSLDLAWIINSGDAGNSVVEQNQRLELTWLEQTYLHVQRTFGGIDSPVAIAKICVPSGYFADWTFPSLVLWFNLYDYIAIALATIDQAFYYFSDEDGNTIDGWLPVNYERDQWFYVKIVATTTSIMLCTSSDGRTWTILLTVERPPTWTIDSDSLIILGMGREANAETFPEPDWNNNATPQVAYNPVYFDDFTMIRSEVITMIGLQSGWYFKVKDGATLIGTSTLANGGVATLNIAAFEDLMPFDKIEVYDENHIQMATYDNTGDIWGGDIYQAT